MESGLFIRERRERHGDQNLRFKWSSGMTDGGPFLLGLACVYSATARSEVRWELALNVVIVALWGRAVQQYCCGAPIRAGDGRWGSEGFIFLVRLRGTKNRVPTAVLYFQRLHARVHLLTFLDSLFCCVWSSQHRGR